MRKAARKKRDKPLYAFVRRGNYLLPDMACDARALDGVAQGERVRVEIKQWRNLDRLRAYWATLHEVVDAADAAPTAEQLHEIIKLELGFVDLVRLPSGVTIGLPGSIALEHMKEHEFIVFFQRAEEWLGRNYGYVRTPRAA